MYKIALLISGYLRSLKINIDKIKKYIIEGNDVDVYINITNDVESKYNNTSTNLDYLNYYLNFKAVIITDNIKFSDDENKNNIYNQNYKFYILNKKRIELEKLEQINYDIVIKLRPDVYLYNNLNLDITKNKVYIPIDSKIDKCKLKNINDHYICDIIAYGDPDIMNKYFDFYLDLHNLVKKYGYVNETLLYNYLIDNSINYILVDILYIVILSNINTIAISGDSGTGKTTLSNILKKLFKKSFILECDRYHKWERGDKNWDIFTHLDPKANYITKMNEDIFDLKIGNQIYQVDYDHTLGKFTEKEIIKSEENIIICGLHTFYNNNNILDLKIYLDIDDNIKIPWKIKRDILKRGYSIENILQQIEKRKIDFNKYIYPQKYVADIIINLYTLDNYNIDFYNFDYNQEIKFNYCIAINCKYNINIYTQNLNNINNIKKKNNFNYIYFDDNIEYEKAILNIIEIFINNN